MNPRCPTEFSEKSSPEEEAPPIFLDVFNPPAGFDPLRSRGQAAARTVEDPSVSLDDSSREVALRTDDHVGVQDLYVDKHLRNVSDRYDFDSIRFGIQPITADAAERALGQPLATIVPPGKCAPKP